MFEHIKNILVRWDNGHFDNERALAAWLQFYVERPRKGDRVIFRCHSCYCSSRHNCEGTVSYIDKSCASSQEDMIYVSWDDGTQSNHFESDLKKV